MFHFLIEQDGYRPPRVTMGENYRTANRSGFFFFNLTLHYFRVLIMASAEVKHTLSIASSVSCTVLAVSS